MIASIARILLASLLGFAILLSAFVGDYVLAIILVLLAVCIMKSYES